MSKSIYLLPILLLFTIFSCSNDNEEEKEIQDYTSFVVIYNANVEKLPNCVAAYKKDNKYYKLGYLGDLTKGKYSPEIRINDNTIKDIYIFSDYMNIIRFDDVYKLEKNKKNIIIIADGTGGIKITDKTDQTQYPQ